MSDRTDPQGLIQSILGLLQGAFNAVYSVLQGVFSLVFNLLQSVGNLVGASVHLVACEFNSQCRVHGVGAHASEHPHYRRAGASLCHYEGQAKQGCYCQWSSQEGAVAQVLICMYIVIIVTSGTAVCCETRVE